MRLDPGVSEDGNLVNTSVACLASSLLAAIRWTETCIYAAANWSAQLDLLEEELRELGFRGDNGLQWILESVAPFGTDRSATAR